MKPTLRLRAAALSGIGVVLALASCSSTAKSTPAVASSPTTASAAASATPLASPPAPPATASATAGGQIAVTGAENLRLTPSKVKCEKTVEADGSALVDITVLTPNTGVGWEVTITSSADSAAVFASPVTYDLAAKNGKATIDFLDVDGSVGAGWTDGYSSGVQLAGTLVLQPDQSGTIDSQLGVYGAAKPPIHLVASWTCSS